jgi:type VII secretion integral membrane protein EccD
VNSTAGTELSRVTIVAPRRRIDLSLPSDVPLAHMLPTLLRAAGENLADAGLAHSGWVLQRLDAPPFDPSRNLIQLGVRDGEVLYFRPRMAQLPDMVFDDVADVIATGVNERSDRWRPQSTRRAGRAAGGALLLAAAAVILLSGPPWIVPTISATVVAVAMLVGAVALSRAYGDSGAATVVGYGAVAFAFVAGLLAPARSTVSLAQLGAPHMLAGFGAVAVVAVFSAVVISDGVTTFVGIASAAFVGLIGAAVEYAFHGLPAAGIAATAAAVVMAFSALIPTLSFRLARLPLPTVPRNAEDLRQEAPVNNASVLLDRTIVADRFSTGFVSAVSLIAMAAILFLATDGGWAAAATAAATSVSLLLRARVFRGRVQKAWMLVAGFGGLAALAIGSATRDSHETAIIMVMLPAVVAAIIAIGLASWLPSNRLTPFWGRAGDILDMLVVISLIPLALAVLDVYSKIRGING